MWRIQSWRYAYIKIYWLIQLRSSWSGVLEVSRGLCLYTWPIYIFKQCLMPLICLAPDKSVDGIRLWEITDTLWCLTSGGSDGKESACNVGDGSLIPRLGRSSEKGNGYPLQDSCLENFVGRGAWQATARGVTESDTTEWLTQARLLICLA